MRTQCFLEVLGAISFATLTAARAVGSSIHPKDVYVQRNGARGANWAQVTTNYVTLKGVPLETTTSGTGSQRLRRWAVKSEDPPGYPYNAGLQNYHDVYYATNLSIGTETISVSIDTGSSDTWFITSPLRCIGASNQRLPEAACGFGQGLQTQLPTLPNVQFGRAYSDGTFVSGYFGFANMTVGGVSIQNQQVGIVNYTYWYGDGKTSGLLGLAYPLMTGIDGNAPTYDPIFTTMWKTDKILPLFTIALTRDDAGRNVTTDQGSYLAFGGLPPVGYNDSTWARTPIQPMSALPGWGVVDNSRGLYVITADAYVYGRQNATITDPESTEGLTFNTKQFPVLVDCGSTLTRLPTALTKSIMKSFNPAAQYLPNDGAWYAPCNARVPKFGIKIGTQQIYWMDRDDLLRPGTRDSETGRLCRVGLMDSDNGPYVLGVTFLSNVVAVFDVGNNEMRFAKRNAY